MTLTPFNFSYYSSTLNKHLTRLGLLTDEQMDFFDEQWCIWRDQQKELTPVQLVEIFPEAKRLILRNLRQMKVEQKTAQARGLEVKREITRKISKIPYQRQWFWRPILELIYCADALEAAANAPAMIKKISFYIATVKRHGEVVEQSSGKITDQHIRQAKEVPLATFLSGKVIKKGNIHWTNCPFHAEKTGSFAVYTHQNSFYCYGCATGGDVIDLVMKTHAVDFPAAVKLILHL